MHFSCIYTELKYILQVVYLLFNYLVMKCFSGALIGTYYLASSCSIYSHHWLSPSVFPKEENTGEGPCNHPS